MFEIVGQKIWIVSCASTFCLDDSYDSVKWSLVKSLQNPFTYLYRWLSFFDTIFSQNIPHVPDRIDIWTTMADTPYEEHYLQKDFFYYPELIVQRIFIHIYSITVCKSSSNIGIMKYFKSETYFSKFPFPFIKHSFLDWNVMKCLYYFSLHFCLL